MSTRFDGIARAFGIAAGAGGVWVGSNTASTVIDPRTNKVVARIPVRYEPRTIAAAANPVWVSIGTPGFDG